MNGLVYVQYNQRLRERFLSRKQRPRLDPLLVDEIDPSSEWLVFEGDDLTWDAVDEAMGAMEANEAQRPQRTTRRQGASSSTRLSSVAEEEIFASDESETEDEVDLHVDDDDADEEDNDDAFGMNDDDWRMEDNVEDEI